MSVAQSGLLSTPRFSVWSTKPSASSHFPKKNLQFLVDFSGFVFPLSNQMNYLQGSSVLKLSLPRIATKYGAIPIPVLLM